MSSVIASRTFAFVAGAIAGLVVLAPVRSDAQWWRSSPHDFESCAHAAEKAKTKEEKTAALAECNAKFAGRRKPGGAKSVIHTFRPNHIPDGFKIDIDGNFWVTTVTSGGIDIVSRDGAAMDFLELDAVPLNCLFEGTSLYVADFGHADTTGEIQMVGRLLRVDVGIHGMPLFTGAIG